MLPTGILVLCLILVVQTNCRLKLDGRIVGGTPVNISSCPYLLSLQINEIHICGASILSHTTGLTAAHCVVNKSIGDMSVYAGSNFYKKEGIKIAVLNAIPHKNYDPHTSDFDIAVLKFASNLPFSNKIAPIALPSPEQVFAAGTPATVCGWGITEEDTVLLSSVVRRVQISIIERPKCQQLFTGVGVITRRMICAGRQGGGRDACQGDSGGPLIVNGVLGGVVSWGHGCARPNYPGVYTRVPKFINWIKRNIMFL